MTKVKAIRKGCDLLTLFCNTGKAIFMGGIRGYGTVWIYPDRIANILSLCNVQKKYKVTHDSSLKTGFVVHKADGMNHVFMHSKKGIFFSDVKEDIIYVTINTADRIKNKYTLKEYSDAHKARSIQDIISRPSFKDCIEYVEQGLIPNCPIIKIIKSRAEDIFGPNL